MGGSPYVSAPEASLKSSQRQVRPGPQALAMEHLSIEAPLQGTSPKSKTIPSRCMSYLKNSCGFCIQLPKINCLVFSKTVTFYMIYNSVAWLCVCSPMWTVQRHAKAQRRVAGRWAVGLQEGRRQARSSWHRPFVRTPWSVTTGGEKHPEASGGQSHSWSGLSCCHWATPTISRSVCGL